MKRIVILISFVFCLSNAWSQKSDRLPLFLGDLIVSDSTSTIMIPVRYNSSLYSTNKIALMNEVYANVLFYNFKTDTYHKMFEEDTYINGFPETKSIVSMSNSTVLSHEKWNFFFVKTQDFDKSGRVDSGDPSVLFVTDKQGNNKKELTPDDQNAVALYLFPKLDIALIKMQRDHDGDYNFESGDKDFYYLRLDLKTLELGKKIELK